MGGGPKRKENDTVIIRPRKGQSGGSGGGSQDKAGNIKCPKKLRVDLPKGFKMVAGMKPALNVQGDQVLLLINSTEIGTLPRKDARMVVRCQSEGFNYTGEFSSDRGMLYVLFTRTP